VATFQAGSIGEGYCLKMSSVGDHAVEMQNCVRLPMRGLGGVVGLMLPLVLAAAVRVPYTTSPCSDLGQVVNLSLSVA